MGQKQDVVANEAPRPGFSWPMDEVGKPMAMVTFGAHELIGLPKFSNVTIGPASCTLFVKADPESRKAGMSECARSVESVLSRFRTVILDELARQGISAES